MFVVIANNRPGKQHGVFVRFQAIPQGFLTVEISLLLPQSALRIFAAALKRFLDSIKHSFSVAPPKS
jgi:hypothetical protein